MCISCKNIYPYSLYRYKLLSHSLSCFLSEIEFFVLYYMLLYFFLYEMPINKRTLSYFQKCDFSRIANRMTLVCRNLSDQVSQIKMRNWQRRLVELCTNWCFNHSKLCGLSFKWLVSQVILWVKLVFVHVTELDHICTCISKLDVGNSQNQMYMYTQYMLI